MCKKYDFSKGKVDNSIKERIIFIERLALIMQNYCSTNKDIDELVNWLYAKASDSKYWGCDVKSAADNFEGKSLIKIDDNRIVKEVFYNDLILYVYSVALYEHNTWSSKDVLSDIIKELFFLLSKMVFPKDEEKRDIVADRYYIELEFLNKNET